MDQPNCNLLQHAISRERRSPLERPSPRAIIVTPAPALDVEKYPVPKEFAVSIPLIN